MYYMMRFLHINNLDKVQDEISNVMKDNSEIMSESKKIIKIYNQKFNNLKESNNLIKETIGKVNYYEEFNKNLQKLKEIIKAISINLIITTNEKHNLYRLRNLMWKKVND